MYEGRYLVVGPPGTGKTHWLKVQTEQVVQKYQDSMLVNWQQPVMVCSLTRAAAAEVSQRVTLDKGAVGTLHSHCYQGIGRPRLIHREHVAEWNAQSTFELPLTDFPKPPKKKAEDASGAVEAHSDAGDTSPWEETGPQSSSKKGSEVFKLAERLRHMRIDEDQWPPIVKDFYMAWKDFKQEHELIDFTDMIERAVLQCAVAPGNPWVILVDEAQDLSKLERDLILKWGDKAGAVMLVGDPLQTLYAFRGSDPYFFKDDTVPDDKRKVLSQSYRVPKQVLEASRHWVSSFLPDFPQPEYKPKEVFGDVYEGNVRIGEFNWRDPDRLTEEVEAILKHDPNETVMIQATCAYMLFRLTKDLKSWGIPFSNPWRKTHGGWNPLRYEENGTAKRLADMLTVCSDSPKLVPWTYVKIGEFAKSLAARGVFHRGQKKHCIHLAKEYEAHPESTPQEYEISDWFSDDSFLKKAWMGECTEKEFVYWWFEHRSKTTKPAFAEFCVKIVERMGSEGLRNPPRVFVGTIHSFKGAEADHVYVFPDLPPVAFEAWKRQAGSEFEEVVRAFYVAMTRSKEKLTICKAASIKCAPVRRTVGEYVNAQIGGAGVS